MTAVDPKSYTVAFLIMSSFLAMCFLIAPFISPYGSFTGLDGNPGVMDHWDIWSGKEPFTCVVYSIGDMVCHQEQARTLILNGSEMPVCVRDAGLLFGFIIGCSSLLTVEGQMFADRYGRPFVIISFLQIFTDWIIQRSFSLNVPFTRLATGLLAGAGFAILIHLWMRRAFYSDV